MKPSSPETHAPRTEFRSPDGRSLRLELLDDALVHFEYRESREGEIRTTPQVARRDYTGPVELRREANSFETAVLRLEIDPATLDLTLRSKFTGQKLARFSARPGSTRGFSLEMDSPGLDHAYGLGQQFDRFGTTEGDWVGSLRTPGNEHGNGLNDFHGGVHPNIQVPVLHASGPAGSMALFLDDLSPLRWDLRSLPWRIDSRADALRGYLIVGRDLMETRRTYLDLTGRPPVPPRKLFGLWISEWGYVDWAEIDDKIRTLEENRFPLDGVVLDLTWFGGIEGNSEKSRMGSLRWDESHFPDPKAKISSFERDHGLGVMMIEESYVARGLPEHRALEEQGYLARDPETGKAICLTENAWWGLGGLIDWTNPECGRFWHDSKRQPLIDLGITAHWTDLGEPECYDARAVYHGFPEYGERTHDKIHNLYSFKWNESIFDSYRRLGLRQRPFILSRAGAAGMQRLGATLWSADIAANLANLRSHLNVHMHMTMSGYDYYGSDNGGFYREAFDGPVYGECYTRWFAHGCAFDIPLRVHTKNLTKQYETAPDRNGDIASNLANLRQRYELTPYYYTLAHLAWRQGDPVIAPLFLHFPDDPEVRSMGGQKMIGENLLVASAAEHGITHQDVYLPRGIWFDYLNLRRYDSSGEWVRGIELRREGRFRLPTFARAGAIIPKMRVDLETMNVFGRRRDGSSADEWGFRVYPAEHESKFELIEDDGKSIDYQDGRTLMTPVYQKRTGTEVQIRIEPSLGEFEAMPTIRDAMLEVVLEGTPPLTVLVNGSTLPRLKDPAELDRASSGWIWEPNGLAIIKTGPMSVREKRVIELALSPLPTGSLHAGQER